MFYYLIAAEFFISWKNCKTHEYEVKTRALHHIVQSHSVRWLRDFGGPILAPMPYVWQPWTIQTAWNTKTKAWLSWCSKYFIVVMGLRWLQLFSVTQWERARASSNHLPCKECLMGVRGVLTELLFQLVSHLKKKLNWPRKSVTMTSCPWRRRTRVSDNFSKCFSSASTNEPETRAAVTPQPNHKNIFCTMDGNSLH